MSWVTDVLICFDGMEEVPENDRITGIGFPILGYLNKLVAGKVWSAS